MSTSQMASNTKASTSTAYPKATANISGKMVATTKATSNRG